MSSRPHPAPAPLGFETPAPAPAPGMAAGLLPGKEIEALIGARAVHASCPIERAQIQPASLDLRLGRRGFRMRASFLPGPQGMLSRKLPHFVREEVDFTQSPVLGEGSTYLVEVEESLALPKNLAALASPKSSTGRVDVFVRLLAEQSAYFDHVPTGYHGPLWLEITPQSFPVKVRQGTKLSQLRFRRGGRPVSANSRLPALHRRTPLVEPGESEAGRPGWRKSRALQTEGGLVLSVDLAAGVVGYKARRHTQVLDLDQCDFYRKQDFFDPVPAPREGWLILDPGAFYLLASREAVRIPEDYAAEMLPFDPRMGEFRAHYAGFFDPGFGLGTDKGARAVLEIRSRETPFILEHGQAVARLSFEKLTAAPGQIYDSRADASYRGQQLALSKHFKS